MFGLTMLVFFLVFSCFYQVEGANRNVIFERIPSTAGLTGLSCALEEYGKSHARGVRFDSKSGTCEALPESWFTSSTFEDKTYLKLLMEEKIFQAGPSIESEIPPDFSSTGSSVVLTVYMGNIAGYEFAINVQTQNRVIVCYQLNVRIYSNTIVINSFKGQWHHEFLLPTNGRFSPHNTYRFELKITTAAIQESAEFDIPFAALRSWWRALGQSTFPSLALVGLQRVMNKLTVEEEGSYILTCSSLLPRWYFDTTKVV